MNVDLITAVLTMHQPIAVAEDIPNTWRTLCACGDIRDADAHHRHVAEEIMVIAFPSEPPPAWSIEGVGSFVQMDFDWTTS